MLLCMLYSDGLVVADVVVDLSLTSRRVNVSCLVITTILFSFVPIRIRKGKRILSLRVVYFKR